MNIANAYIEVDIILACTVKRRIKLEFDYSKNDFLAALETRIPSKIYQLLQNDFHVYSLDNQGALVELPEFLNLPNGSSIYLYNDSFCEKKLLELLEKANGEELSPVLAYTGVTNVNSFRKKIKNEAWSQKLEKLAGWDLTEKIQALEEALQEMDN